MHRGFTAAGVVGLLLLLAPHQVAKAGSNAARQSIFRPMMVLVGDSLTEFGFTDDAGWGLLLTEAYSRKADVVNRGFGGYTTRMGVYVLDEFLNSFGFGRIKLVTLFFGANDANTPGGIGGYLHVPLDEYKANLVAMVRKLKSKGISNIVVMTPPPVVEMMRLRKDGTPAAGPSNAAMKQYGAAAMAAASSQGVPYVDLFSAISKIRNWRTAALERDGRHLTPLGNKAVFDSLMYVINNSLKSVSPWSLPTHMPTYTRIDARYPAQTFNSLYGYKVNTGVQLPPAAAAAAPAAKTAQAPAAKAAAPAAPAAKAPTPAPAVKTAAAAAAAAPAAKAPTPAPAVKAAAAAAPAAKAPTPAPAVKAPAPAPALPKAAAQRQPSRSTGQ